MTSITGDNDDKNYLGVRDVGDNDGMDKSYDNDNTIDGDLGVGVVAGGSMQVKPSLSNIRPI